jgi:pimeloyl-ACP methyl ester carboxylesterase
MWASAAGGAGAGAAAVLLQQRFMRRIAADPERAVLSEPPEGRPLSITSADGTVLHAEVFGASTGRPSSWPTAGPRTSITGATRARRCPCVSCASSPPSHSQRIADMLPQLERLIVLPETGHMAPLERPEVITEVLLELATTARRDAEPGVA